MCPPPCGPRRSYRRTSVKRVSIYKSEVATIIRSGNFVCEYTMPNAKGYTLYDGCTNNLLMILEDSETTVHVAAVKKKGYRTGYRTIVMDAPCFPATFFIRVKMA